MSRFSLHTIAPLNVITYGENYYKVGHDTYESVHAEDSAMRKLASHGTQKRKRKVDLLVMRINKSGSYGNSKPCLHCILQLSQILPRKGYTLSKVYYTTDKGEMVSTRFQHLLQDEDQHVSKYYKERNFQVRKK